MNTFCAKTGKTFNETAIEFGAAVFNKRSQQYGQEFRNKTQLLKNLARFLLVFILIHGKDKHDRLLVQFVLTDLQRDVYKTWTSVPWTIPVDLVHGPLRGPGPWTTPVDHH